MRASHVDESLKYEFSQMEVLQLGRQAAAEKMQAIEWEQRKADANKFFKEAIDSHEEEVTRLSRLVNNGFEYRWVRCEVHYNDPRPGEKSVYRTDSGELVMVRPMTDSERQEEFPLEVKTEGEELFAAEVTTTITEEVTDAITQ